MNRLTQTFICVLLFGASGCAATPEGIAVSRDEMGDAWPFTIEQGRVTCQNTDIGTALFFTYDGKTYSINGTALTKKLAPDIEKSGFWAPNDKHPEFKLKKDIGPIMEKARAACPP